MKCITDGKVVRRVSDKEAEHYINHEGWAYAQKKVQVDGFVCSKCGKKYTMKPSECDGVVTTHKKGKNGEEVVQRHQCKNKTFNATKIFVASWK